MCDLISKQRAGIILTQKKKIWTIYVDQKNWTKMIGK